MKEVKARAKVCPDKVIMLLHCHSCVFSSETRMSFLVTFPQMEGEPFQGPAWPGDGSWERWQGKPKSPSVAKRGLGRFGAERVSLKHS